MNTYTLQDQWDKEVLVEVKAHLVLIEDYCFVFYIEDEENKLKKAIYPVRNWVLRDINYE